MTTVLYQVSDGALLGYTATDTPNENQIPNPLPPGTATKIVSANPGRPTKTVVYVWNPATLDFDEVVNPRSRLIVVSDLLDRFTSDELEAIHGASKAATNVGNKISVFLNKMQAMGVVSLDDAYLGTALNAFESGGLIAAGRANEIRGI